VIVVKEKERKKVSDRNLGRDKEKEEERSIERDLREKKEKLSA
jgi:hypothetical protein